MKSNSSRVSRKSDKIGSGKIHPERYLQYATSIGDHILKNLSTHSNGNDFFISLKKDAKNRQWRNHDNLYAGLNGTIYFLLELYVVTRESRFLTAVERGVTFIDRYIKARKINNETLCFGSMGFGVLAIRLFEVTSKREYLDMATRQMIGFFSPSSNRGMYSRLALWDGLPGIALGCIRIAAATLDQSTRSDVEILLQKILGQLPVVSSHKTKLSKEFDESLAYGSSGLAFFLTVLGDVFSNPVFHTLAKQQLNVLTERIPARSAKISMENGLIGVALAKLHCGIKLRDNTQIRDACKIGDHLIRLNRHTQPRHAHSLISGIAAEAILSNNLYRFTKIKKYDVSTRQLMTVLEDRYIGKTGKIINLKDMSLANGAAGLGLMFLEIGQASNVQSFIPFLPQIDVQEKTWRHQISKIFTLSNIKKGMVRHNFPKSADALYKLKHPAASILTDVKNPLVQQDLQHLVTALEGTHEVTTVASTLHQELIRFNIQNNSVWMKPVKQSKTDNFGRITTMLLLPYPELVNVPVKLNDRASIVSFEKRIDSILQLDKIAYLELLKNYGEKSAVLVPNPEGSVEEYRPGIFKMLLDRFHVESTAKKEIESLIRDMRTIDPNFAILKEAMSVDLSDDVFLETLRELLFEKFRDWVMTEVLVSNK